MNNDFVLTTVPGIYALSKFKFTNMLAIIKYMYLLVALCVYLTVVFHFLNFIVTRPIIS